MFTRHDDYTNVHNLHMTTKYVLPEPTPANYPANYPDFTLNSAWTQE